VVPVRLAVLWGESCAVPSVSGRIPDRGGEACPGPLEVASFNDDVEELAQQMKAIELRLARSSSR
jgi:hypothetical protein